MTDAFLDVTVEEGSTYEVPLPALGGSGGQWTLEWHTVSGSATAGEDFTPTSGIRDQTSTGYTISVPVLEDGKAEGDETFMLVWTSKLVGAPGSEVTAYATVHIPANTGGSGLPVAYFMPGPYEAQEGNDHQNPVITFDVELSEAAKENTFIKYHVDNLGAVLGKDYELVDPLVAGSNEGVLKIPKGSIFGHIDVRVLSDNLDEGNEHFQVVLEKSQTADLPGNVSSQPIDGRIIDDDGPPDYSDVVPDTAPPAEANWNASGSQFPKQVQSSTISFDDGRSEWSLPGAHLVEQGPEWLYDSTREYLVAKVNAAMLRTQSAFLNAVGEEFGAGHLFHKVKQAGHLFDALVNNHTRLFTAIDDGIAGRISDQEISQRIDNAELRFADESGNISHATRIALDKITTGAVEIIPTPDDSTNKVSSLAPQQAQFSLVESYATDVRGGEGNDGLYGGSQDDTLRGMSGNDILVGGVGKDKLYGDSGEDALFGGTGNDRLYGGADNNRLYGGDGNDKLYGGADDDKLDGGPGNDTLKGGTGRDIIFGGTGNDRLDGGLGKDEIHGGDGDDIVIGSDDRDTVYGGNGDDVLVSGVGIYKFNGGKGQDSIDYTAFDDDVAVTLKGSTQVYVLFNGGRTDHIRNVEGISTGDGDDRLVGDDAANTFDGGSGDDTLFGRKGDDILRGGKGKDIIDGSRGVDRLFGGSDSERDTFVFRKGDSGKTHGTIDQITQFDPAHDRIDLSAIDGDPAAGDQPLRYVSSFKTAKESQPAGQVQVVDAKSNVKVEIDIDGDNAADMIILVKHVDSLTSHDFLL